MRNIIIYLFIILIIVVALSIIHLITIVPVWYIKNLSMIQCTYIGSLAGILYCLRAIYINKAVRQNWDENWHVWYYLRPLTSGISGFISFIFLKAGLLILDASSNQTASEYGYLAVAFIAGYNVDNFLKKLESIALSLWGIEKTNTAIDSNDKGDENG